MTTTDDPVSQVKKIPQDPGARPAPPGSVPDIAGEDRLLAQAEKALRSLHPAPQPGTRITGEGQGQGQAKPDPKPAQTAARSGPKPMAGAARLKRRHRSVLLSFLLGVLLPVGCVAWYLWARAADQYASTVAFSVRTEQPNSPLELLGGLTSLSGSSSSDTDILYEYLQSQKLVADMDAQIDLRELWSKPGARDPWFAFDTSGTVEDLVTQWDRMVRISYDDGAGLIEVRVLAFDPGDAQLIARALYNHSTQMINELSAIAREDAIRYARQDLQEALERLKIARAAVTRFRNENQMVDPSADLATQTGLLSSLQQQLADLLIEYDLLSLRTRPDDPRIAQAESRIEVIRNRIAAERRKLGLAGGGAAGEEVYANLFGEYERLVVDREFAERSYTTALASYDAAQAEARRQSRYLAAYVKPTLAESARFPERGVLLALAGLLILLVWGTLVLVLYALKDRR
ncbi:hypothetical protein [Sagittula sp. S175]|uniref:hypothetical protein n=1 Tax=Sagittula sp. S175 TaxID=3415129 RepID=UPI003C7E8EFB